MAQNDSMAQGSQPVTIPLAPGTAINASLVGTIDSEKSKPGDEVNAIVVEPVVYQRSVLLPKGSRISGHVVRTGDDGNGSISAVFVEFDKAILKGGQEAVLNAGIQALAPAMAAPTIPSRERYEENRMAELGRPNEARATNDNMVLPSNYTLPRRATPDTPAQKLEGGLDRKGMFTPDSKGAFEKSGLKIFTPMSEGSHGTVLVSKAASVHLENGTHLLIVVQPPAGQ
jgi:hypothetical protein